MILFEARRQSPKNRIQPFSPAAEESLTTVCAATGCGGNNTIVLELKTRLNREVDSGKRPAGKLFFQSVAYALNRISVQGPG
jgi:hypothetical protein